jgi:hypothetical protein
MFNSDLALLKSFRWSESKQEQFRLETFNTFNHTQFGAFDTTARFDATGKQVNPTLGQFTSSRTPRQIQMAVRFTF